MTTAGHGSAYPPGPLDTPGPVPAAAPAAAPRPAPAPLTVGELVTQERKLTLRRFTLDDAWALGSLLVEMAHLRQAPVSIDIRRGTQQLFHCALEGSSADNDAWIDRKRRVVERYGESSLLVGARHRAKGTTFEESSRLDPDLYAAHGGSFPIKIEGAGVVGTITVSGLPQAEDHAMVVEALERYLSAHRGSGH